MLSIHFWSRGLIDTGADVSLIDSSYAKRLGVRADQNRQIIIKDLNKSRIPAKHCTISVTSIRNYKLSVPFNFYLFENLYSIIDAHLLIGMNVINEISRKYGGFLIPMIKNGEKLKNSINQDKGLVLMAKKSKWAFLDWDESGEPRTYDEAIQEAIKILNNDILTESYRHLNKIGKGYF